ncbi:MAG: hypothetical protein WD069_00720 [Planctomycetales bacterium]
MSIRLSNRLSAAAALLVVVAFASKPQPAVGCSAPVFRYALENWPPDRYEVVVFHAEKLSAEQEQLVAELGEEGRVGRSAANLRLRFVALNDEPAAEDAELFDRQNASTTPWMLVRYPPAKRTTNFADVWAGPLTPENVERLIDSPARREIARRLLGGHSAVWVFLDGGDRQRDDEKFALLEQQLKTLETTLALPEIDPSDIESGEISEAAANLTPRFSAVRIGIDDPAEALLAAMLRNSEEDGTEESLSAYHGEPLAFPVFGRGRALFAYVGEGINRDMIADGCGQLVAKCLCTRKADFQGTDLMMAVDWDALVDLSEAVASALPPLIGPGTLAVAAVEVDNGAENEAADDRNPAGLPVNPESADRTHTVVPVEMVGGRWVVFSVVGLAALGIIGVVTATLVAARRKERR